MRTLPARVGAAPFLDRRAEDLSQVQEPLLGHAKEGCEELTASRADSREGSRRSGDIID